jgi:exonuclease SbcC
MQNWLEEHFVNLMGTIEKHVMLSIYHEFNEHFQQWFNILIEDEGINVKLDEEFTPFIEQNGYETSIANLSGGERTSVALAYRLALNKVINDIIGDIKTKDILILDEPTDGFSTEQLDKVRDVLDELNLKQTIIVSHESKIEGFVDNVIRVSKEEHVSNIMGP